MLSFWNTGLGGWFRAFQPLNSAKVMAVLPDILSLSLLDLLISKKIAKWHWINAESASCGATLYSWIVARITAISNP